MYSMLQKSASSDSDVRRGLKQLMMASKVLSSVNGAGVGDNDAGVVVIAAFVLFNFRAILCWKNVRCPRVLSHDGSSRFSIASIQCS